MARMFSGKRLRAERVAAGVTAERLAIELDRTAFSIRGYETGRVAPTVAGLAKIADVLGCSIDRLFEDVPE